MDDGVLLGVTMMAMRWGHRSMMENAVERLGDGGVPIEGFMESFNDIWDGADTSAAAANLRCSEAARRTRFRGDRTGGQR